MWDTPFEESMLGTHKNLIIHCPSKDLAVALMEILERNNVMWPGGGAPTTDTNWSIEKEDTCYWVESGKLYYSDKQYADEGMDGEYAGHMRCTFYGVEGSNHGVESPDFCAASDAELCALLGM